jgi:hypothetical protein
MTSIAITHAMGSSVATPFAEGLAKKIAMVAAAFAGMSMSTDARVRKATNGACAFAARPWGTRPPRDRSDV